MNRVLAFILLLVIAASSLSFTGASVTNSDVTLKMLNCKPGLYRTYNDFLKGNAEPLTFVRYKYSWVTGNMKYFGIMFKDENGKKIKIACDEFWGWKCDAGLFRNVPYQTGDVKAISARVTCVGDFVFYNTFGNESITFKPYTWLSQNLNSEMMSPEAYTKKYPDTKYPEVYEYLYKKCKTKSVYSKLELMSYTRPEKDCLLKCPNLLYGLDNYSDNSAAKYIAID